MRDLTAKICQDQVKFQTNPFSPKQSHPYIHHVDALMFVYKHLKHFFKVCGGLYSGEVVTVQPLIFQVYITYRSGSVIGTRHHFFNDQCVHVFQQNISSRFSQNGESESISRPGDTRTK